MSEAEHTPGPWHADGSRVWGDTAELQSGGTMLRHKIADAAYHAEGGFEEQHANARLIAAAPELLAALERIVGRDLTYFRGTVCEGQISFEAVQAARAVIAKAKGA